LFLNGQHDFLGEERGKKEERKTRGHSSFPDGSEHEPRYCDEGGEAHRTPP